MLEQNVHIGVVFFLFIWAFSIYILLGMFKLRAVCDNIIAFILLFLGLLPPLLEILSFLHDMSITALFISHIIILVVLIGVWKIYNFPKPCFTLNYKELYKMLFSKLDILTILGLFAFFIGIICFFIAILTPPNNWDSMTYHMSRVGYWYQWGTLEHYFTNNYIQLSFSPGAEIMILWTVIISNSDILANCVQLICFFGILILIYAMARWLGFNQKSSLFAMLCSTMIPILILESTNTQNDLVVCFFIIACLYFLLKFLDFKSYEDFEKPPKTSKNIPKVYKEWNGKSGKSKFSYNYLFLSCFSGALAVLVKNYVGIYIPIFLLLFFIPTLIERRKIGTIVKWVILFTLIFALTSGPYLVRNYNYYGDPLGPESALAEDHSLKFFIENSIKNIGLNIEFPPGLERFRGVSEIILYKIFDCLNISHGYPGYSPSLVYHLKTFVPHMDLAGVGLPILILFFGVIYISTRNLITNIITKKYFDIKSIYFIIFILCSFIFIYTLNCGPWSTRRQITLIVMLCPLLSQIYMRYNTKRVIHFCAIILVFGAIVFGTISAVSNVSKPIIPYKTIIEGDISYINESILFMSREQIMFNVMGKNPFYDSYMTIESAKPKINKLGVCLYGGDWDYPAFGKKFKRTVIHLPQNYTKNGTSFNQYCKTNKLDAVLSRSLPDNITCNYYSYLSGDMYLIIVNESCIVEHISS